MNNFELSIGFLVLLVFMLAINISRIRIEERIGSGDGGKPRLRRAIRAHMNAIEHILPFSLLLFVARSQESMPSILLNWILWGFLIARYLHAYAMLRPKFELRILAATTTYVIEFIGCFIVLAGAVMAKT